jgi:hypothetical protein
VGESRCTALHHLLSEQQVGGVLGRDSGWLRQPVDGQPVGESRSQDEVGGFELVQSQGGSAQVG